MKGKSKGGMNNCKYRGGGYSESYDGGHEKETM